MESVTTWTRKYQHRCGVCQFVAKYPDAGELLETWLVTGSRPLSAIAEHFNSSEVWADKHSPFTYKKLYVHKTSHLPDRDALLNVARQKILEGGATLESCILDTVMILAALKAQGVELVKDGVIRVSSIADLAKVIDMETKLLGSQSVEINVSPAQGGPGLLSPDVILALREIVMEFVPVAQHLALREAWDDRLLPLYIDSHGGETGQGRSKDGGSRNSA